MSTLRKYEFLKGRKKLPNGGTTKVHISKDYLSKIDAVDGSLLADDSLNRVYMDDLPNFPVL
jgi:hypothetical protein